MLLLGPLAAGLLLTAAVLVVRPITVEWESPRGDDIELQCDGPAEGPNLDRLPSNGPREAICAAARDQRLSLAVLSGLGGMAALSAALSAVAARARRSDY